MFDSIFSYFIPAVILSLIVSIVYFFFEKRKIIENYTESNSKQLKNITGLIILDGGSLKKRVQFCNFDLLIMRVTYLFFLEVFILFRCEK